MSFLKSKSLTGKYFLGVGVAILLGVGAYITSQNPAVQEAVEKGSRNIAAFLNPNEHLARLNAADRTRLANEYFRQRCVNATGEEQSCGFHSWPQGVPMDRWVPQDPYMAKIPPNTRVEVRIECDPKTRKFYTNVYFPRVCPNNVQTSPGGALQISQGTKCGEFYFQNPYEPYIQDSPTAPFSDRKQNWITSPGVFNRDDMTNLTGVNSKTVDMNKLGAQVLAGGSNAVTEHHVVSEAKEWHGAKMTNTIWLKGDFAIHGSPLVTGRPESRGCIRLHNDKIHGFKAQGLYMLTKRVGTNNMNYYFSGYGPSDPAIGGRPACSLSSEEYEKYRALGKVPPETEAQANARRDTAARESSNSLGALGRWWNNLWSGKRLRSGNTTIQRGGPHQGSER